MIITYSVDDASQPTKLYNYQQNTQENVTINGTKMFDKVEIDGAEISVADLDIAQGTYPFSVGKHIVEYKLKDETKIDDWSFAVCTAIEEVIIPDNVVTIKGNAFDSDVNISSVTIGSSVRYLGEGSFYLDAYTSPTISFYIKPTTPPFLLDEENPEFSTLPFQTSNKIKLYVPSQSLNEYKAAWPDYESQLVAMPTT